MLLAQVDNASRIRAVVDPLEAGSDGGGLPPNSDTSHRRPRLDSTPHPPGFLPDEEPSSSQSSSPPSESDDLVLRGRVAPLELIVLLALGGAVLSVMATLAPGCVARHLAERDRRPAPSRRHRSRSLSPSTSARTTFPPSNGSPVWPSGSHRSASLSSTSTWASSITTFSDPPASAIGGGGILRASRSRPWRGNKHVSFSLQNSAALVYEEYSDPLVSDPEEEEKEGNLTIEDILEGGTGIAVAPLPLCPSLPAAARRQSVVQPPSTTLEEVKGDVGRSRRGICGSPKRKTKFDNSSLTSSSAKCIHSLRSSSEAFPRLAKPNTTTSSPPLDYFSSTFSSSSSSLSDSTLQLVPHRPSRLLWRRKSAGP